MEVIIRKFSAWTTSLGILFLLAIIFLFMFPIPESQAMGKEDAAAKIAYMVTEVAPQYERSINMKITDAIAPPEEEKEEGEPPPVGEKPEPYGQ